MQRAGPINVSLDGVVIALWRNLLPVFKPIDLWLWTPSHSTREGHGHPLKDLVMFQLHLKEGSCCVFHRHIGFLHLISGLLHRGALQPVLNLTDQPLLTAGDFVLLIGCCFFWLLDVEDVCAVGPEQAASHSFLIG